MTPDSLPPELRLGSHCLHDAGDLLERWEALARQRGWRRHVLAREEEFELPFYEIGEPGGDSFYLSAGIHGDEPVPPWALWHGCREFAGRLEERGAVVVPLWNPWGLRANRREDAEGHDLNRIFHHRDHPRLERWIERIERWRFEVVLALHEDFDACGWYLYEISSPQPRLIEAIRRATAGVLEPDPRSDIEGRVADRGLIWTDTLPPDMPEWPEVFALAGHGEPVLLTFETPSEACLEQRALAHLLAIEAVVG